jgi:hypothetical protein
MLDVVPLGVRELFGKVFPYLLKYRSTTQRPDFIQVQKEISAKYVPQQRRFWSKVSLLALLFLCTSRDMKGGLQFSE